VLPKERTIWSSVNLIANRLTCVPSLLTGLVYCVPTLLNSARIELRRRVRVALRQKRHNDALLRRLERPPTGGIQPCQFPLLYLLLYVEALPVRNRYVVSFQAHCISVV